jgi:hypothetical protein
MAIAEVRNSGHHRGYSGVAGFDPLLYFKHKNPKLTLNLKLFRGQFGDFGLTLTLFPLFTLQPAVHHTKPENPKKNS